MIWKNKLHFRALGAYLALAMFIIGSMPGDILAGMALSVPLGENGELSREADLSEIRKTLEARVVSDRLETLGYSAVEIDRRLAMLDDAELHDVALKIDELQKGGDAIGVVIGLLVVALLVVIILKLLDKKIVVS